MTRWGDRERGQWKAEGRWVIYPVLVGSLLIVSIGFVSTGLFRWLFRHWWFLKGGLIIIPCVLLGQLLKVVWQGRDT